MNSRNHLLAWTALGCCALAAGCFTEKPQESPKRDLSEQVTQFGKNNSAIVPTQQVLTPAGTQIELPGMRPQAIALSPDGQLLATSGKTAELVLLDAASGSVKQKVPLPPESAKIDASGNSARNLRPDKGAELSFTGLIFSPDGRHIYLSDVKGSVKVFEVDADHKVVARGSIHLPPTGLGEKVREIPAGLTTSPDGTRLYVAMNVSNRVAEIESATGQVLRTFDVGNAPFDVVLVKDKLYVSNWGGRRPDASSLTGPISPPAGLEVVGPSSTIRAIQLASMSPSSLRHIASSLSGSMASALS